MSIGEASFTNPPANKKPPPKWLARTSGNQLRAAELLGIHRTTLRKRAMELGLVSGGTGAAEVGE